MSRQKVSLDLNLQHKVAGLPVRHLLTQPLQPQDCAFGDAGDTGRDALSILLEHEDPGVRCVAAAYLLRYKTEDAMNVLRELAAGRGVVALAAQCTIENWEDGSWELDPEPQE